jgi:hypothetical protein
MTSCLAILNPDVKVDGFDEFGQSGALNVPTGDATVFFGQGIRGYVFGAITVLDKSVNALFAVGGEKNLDIEPDRQFLAVNAATAP